MVKAAVIQGPNEFVVQEFDMPEVAADAMLVKVGACGVCGTDVHIFRGHLKAAPFPLIPGHEFSGKIERLGHRAGASMVVHGGELAEGDAVTVVPGLPCGRCFYCRKVPDRPNLCINRQIYGVNRSAKEAPHLYGGYSEFIYIEPGSWVYRLPEGMSLELGALAEPTATATRALERAGGVTGKSVVVQGVGPIGLLTVAAAKVGGAGRVIAVDRVEQRLRMAERFGAGKLIDMREFDTPEARAKRVQELTRGIGADVVVECAGVPGAVSEGLQMVRRGGKYVEVGHFTDTGAVEIRPHTICFKDLDILGSYVYPMWQFERALDVLASREYPFEELFTHRFKIEEAKEAILVSERGECIKAMVKP